jgi:plasmid stabilization system protein ParE
VEIVWSLNAENSYLTIIEHVFDKWGIIIVEKLEFQVNQLLENITKYNHICPKSIFLDLHKCIVNKHISLIYRISNKNKIEIVILIFNQSEHPY